MSKAPKKNLELAPSPVFATPPPIVTQKPLDTYSYTLGFTKGYKEGDSAFAGWAFGICGVLAVVIAFVALWTHISRLTDVLEKLQSGVLEKLNKEKEHLAGGKKSVSLLLPLVLTACLAGCAGKQSAGEPVPPVPMPPQTMEQPSLSVKEGEKMDFATPPYAEEGAAQYVVASAPAELSQGPRTGEPEELATLLEMKRVSAQGETAVSLMRPSAIREAAQTVTLQTAIAYRYKQLLAATERHSGILDAAFDFSPLLMTEGDALIMPPLLTRSGASMRIESAETATAAKTTYELLAPARYISTIPNWRVYLMVDAFPEPEKTNPAVMPKNDKERAIWRAAVREAWAQGVAEADQLYADNVSRMTREYRGVMLYHLLTAQHLLSRVNTSSADLGLQTSDNGNKLNIGQRVYRITAPSAFTIPDSEMRYPLPGKSSKREQR